MAVLKKLVICPAGHKILSLITAQLDTTFINNNFGKASLFNTTNYTANFQMCIYDDTPEESYKSKAFFKFNTNGSPYILLKHAVVCV
jgi:hypothetical protein